MLLAPCGKSPGCWGTPYEAQDSPATRNSLVQTVNGAEVDKLPERNRKLKALKFQRNGNAKK